MDCCQGAVRHRYHVPFGELRHYRPVSVWASSGGPLEYSKVLPARERLGRCRLSPTTAVGASSCSSIFWRLSWTPTQRWTPNCDGTKSHEIRLQSSYALPFDAVDEVLPREAPVLYVPMSLTADPRVRWHHPHSCPPRAIRTVPSSSWSACSTTNPRDAARVDKALRCLEPMGVAGTLARCFPALRRIVALVFDGDLLNGELSSEKAASTESRRPPSDGGGVAQAAVQVAALFNGFDGRTRPAATVVRYSTAAASCCCLP